MAAEPPASGADGNVCPRCGTPSAAGQEYCLECGLRLGGGGFVGALSTAWRERLGWYPGDWIWPVLLGLLIAIIGGAVAAVFAASGGSGNPLVATHSGQPRQPVTPPETATVSISTAPSGTATGPPPTPTTPPPATTTAPRPPASPGLIAWPANRNGWTVVLESVPTSAGRAPAVARARAALRAGLLQVGVLNSGQYSSLHPGYYVVFSGVYASQGAANAAASAAAGKGFTAAYSREITR